MKVIQKQPVPVYVTNGYDNSGYIRITDVSLPESKWYKKFFAALDPTVAEIVGDEAELFLYTKEKYVKANPSLPVVDMTFDQLVAHANQYIQSQLSSNSGSV